MYEIKSSETKKKTIKPYYKIEFSYMIGDADGHTEETIKFGESEFTEDVQKHLRALEKFSQLTFEGYWGVSFDDEYLDKAIKQNLLTDEEIKILKSEFDKGYKNDDDYYFEDVLLTYCEYSFYTIQGIDIVYVDENNVKHEVVWKD